MRFVDLIFIQINMYMYIVLLTRPKVGILWLIPLKSLMYICATKKGLIPGNELFRGIGQFKIGNFRHLSCTYYFFFYFEVYVDVGNQVNSLSFVATIDIRFGLLIGSRLFRDHSYIT